MLASPMSAVDIMASGAVPMRIGLLRAAQRAQSPVLLSSIEHSSQRHCSMAAMASIPGVPHTNPADMLPAIRLGGGSCSAMEASWTATR